MTGAVVFQSESTNVHLFCNFYFFAGGRRECGQTFVSHFSYFVSDPLDPKMN